jgi:phosphomannomutase
MSLSEYLAPIDTRVRSGEINSEVTDVHATMDLVRERFSDGEIDTLDGMTISYPSWWFNLRPSNTQPLLRLNVEADTRDELERRTAEVLAVIRG